MAIQGPLRELGIHDVFQLLDLSRKTGALTVTSTLRNNQGTVYFDRGAVIYAAVRSNPHPLGALLLRMGKISEADLLRARDTQRGGDRRRLGEILVAAGAVTARELERQVRFQVEEVVFELMSWQEGFFSFEERAVEDVPAEAAIRISTESLLMEGARRIDEWSRIESKVPGLDAVPRLAAAEDGRAAALDLLPTEWSVLATVDGAASLRAIATQLAMSEFDVARIAYGLVSTGVIELRAAARRPAEHDGEGQRHLERGRAALAAGQPEAAAEAAHAALAADAPVEAEARLLLGQSLVRCGRYAEAAEELRRAVQTNALDPMTHRELGVCAARQGELADAIASWQRYLRLAPEALDAPRLRHAVEAAAVLRDVLAEVTDD